MQCIFFSPPAEDRYDTARLNRVWSAHRELQSSNLRKVAATSFRYKSELALDLGFEIWFHGGMIARSFTVSHHV